MTLVNPYTSLEHLKAVLDIDPADTTDDARLENLINTVSRWIENFTGRYFYESSSESRFYTAEGPRYIEIDDCLSVTEIAVDDDASYGYSTTLDSGDYSLEPINSPALGKPYDHIIILANATDCFPRQFNGVKVTGTWGYSTATPDDVKQACLIQCHRLWKRRNLPFGVSGPNQFGQIQALSRLDPDVEELLSYYCRGD